MRKYGDASNQAAPNQLPKHLARLLFVVGISMWKKYQLVCNMYIARRKHTTTIESKYRFCQISNQMRDREKPPNWIDSSYELSFQIKCVPNCCMMFWNIAQISRRGNKWISFEFWFEYEIVRKNKRASNVIRSNIK